MAEFDPSKDYYAILGVSKSSTIDEIKAAHVSLALKYHPDTASNEVINDGNEGKFVEVSEAWSVLSKPELRIKYDQSRTLFHAELPSVGERRGTSSTYRPGFMGPLDSIAVQRLNFVNNVQKAASSNWKDKKDKYRSESWHNLPLSEKKASRIKPVISTASFMAPFFVGVALLGVGYAAYLYSDDNKPNKRASKR